MEIRHFRPDDIPTLVALFRDTIRRVNSRDYSPEQVRAWAPDDVDPARWATLTDRFTVVAEMGGHVAGFADLETDGHVDRFFVHADYQRQGVGRALLAALVAEAVRVGMGRLFAEVSITARPFFTRHGFSVLAEQVIQVRGVSMTNFRMERRF
ncbi:putative acetyltransferase [Fimbriiglobus ruber]|uniref:Putative acetyltransferase n=1 Tax=Fimbriiglobus ruber TaxID=1908690 RepID=A0A225DP38_9BACT|nr:putative acetyltransferase [Fimbriiglobus ruber]